MATEEKYGRYFGFYVTALDRKDHESDRQEEAATALFPRPTAYDIADHIVTLEKLANGFELTHDYIGAGEIWSHHIAAEAITTHHLVAGSITIDKLAFVPLYSQTGDPTEIIATINASPESGTLTIKSSRIHLAADSVIADDVIKARHIDVAELSAISADLGTVTAGKISVAGGLVRIGENVFSTQDGIYVGQGGTIIVTDADGNVVFDTSSKFQGPVVIQTITGTATANSTSTFTTNVPSSEPAPLCQVYVDFSPTFDRVPLPGNINDTAGNPPLIKWWLNAGASYWELKIDNAASATDYPIVAKVFSTKMA